MYDQRQRTINCLLGVHLGDALGVPFEMMTRAEILAAVGPEGVTGPRFDLDPSTRKIPDTRGLPPGSTSDDTQLTEATAKGLIMAGRYDHEIQTLLHLEALWNDVAGWGGTTKRSLYEVDKWYRRQSDDAAPPVFKSTRDEKMWLAAEPRDPNEPARWHPNARGNGPSMKIAPLALHYALRARGDFYGFDMLPGIFQFSRMTHADPICAIAAFAIACVIRGGVMGTSPGHTFMTLEGCVKEAELELEEFHQGPERFSVALKQALALSGEPEKLWAFGSAGIADSMTTVPMAIAIWYRHCEYSTPAKAVCEAINAGGDTDTVAAMVGAMMGAHNPYGECWPDEWTDALQDKGVRARDLGWALHKVSTGRGEPTGYDLEEIKRRLGY